MFRAQAAWRSTWSPEGLAPLWMPARGYTHFLNKIMLTPATWAQLLPCDVEMMHSAMCPHAVCTMSAITIPLGLPKVLPCMCKGCFCYYLTFTSWTYESMGFTLHNVLPSAVFFFFTFFCLREPPSINVWENNVHIYGLFALFKLDWAVVCKINTCLLIRWRTIVFNQER